MPETDSKKVVLFLVEGTSDEIALGQPLRALIQRDMNLEWERFKTDVFTVRLYPESASFAIEGKIANTIKRFVEDRLKRGDCYYRRIQKAHEAVCKICKEILLDNMPRTKVDGAR